MDDTNGSAIRSVDISCTIVEALEEGGPAGVTALAERLDHSKSTIHDHLATLRKNRLVIRENDTYRLGLRFERLSHHAKNQYCDYSIVQEAVDELAAETGERAQFGGEDYGKLIYVYRTDNNPDVTRPYRPDIEEPLHCTALGKAMLAHMPRDRVDEIVDEHGLETRTSNTITEYDELVAELDRVRDQGYAIDDEELANGMRCVAAPILDDEAIVGSIGVFGSASRFTDDRLERKLTDQVRQAANLVEINSMFSK